MPQQIGITAPTSEGRLIRAIRDLERGLDQLRKRLDALEARIAALESSS